MNAPGALAVSKLLYPETEESKLKKLDNLPNEEKWDTCIEYLFLVQVEK